MNIPNDLKYSAEHEWVRVEGDEVVIGVTDFAQGEMGDVVFLEIETEGESLSKGEIFGTIEAVKTVSDLYMPLDGEVLAVNPALEDTPELVNSSAFEEGWMIRVKLSNPAQLDDLMSAEAYAELIG